MNSELYMQKLIVHRWYNFFLHISTYVEHIFSGFGCKITTGDCLHPQCQCFQGVWLGGFVKKKLVGPRCFLLRLIKMFLPKLGRKLKRKHWCQQRPNFPALSYIFFSSSLSLHLCCFYFIFQRFNQIVAFASSFFCQRWVLGGFHLFFFFFFF